MSADLTRTLRALHQQMDCAGDCYPECGGICRECGRMWPCDTFRRMAESDAAAYVTTLDDLKALPNLTVIRWYASAIGTAGVLEKLGNQWFEPGGFATMRPELIPLPAEVLLTADESMAPIELPVIGGDT